MRWSKIFIGGILGVVAVASVSSVVACSSVSNGDENSGVMPQFAVEPTSTITFNQILPPNTLNYPTSFQQTIQLDNPENYDVKLSYQFFDAGKATSYSWTEAKIWTAPYNSNELIVYLVPVVLNDLQTALDYLAANYKTVTFVLTLTFYTSGGSLVGHLTHTYGFLPKTDGSGG